MDEEERTTHADQLSRLLTHILADQENERRTITRVLQEDVGQLLVALAMRLRVAENASDQAQSSALIAEARGLTTEALHGIERLVRCLYPPALEAQGLNAALEVYAQDFAKNAQIRVDLHIEVFSRRLPHDVELALFRITQEALENARTYAYAGLVQINLSTIGGFICLTIADDGAGYPPASPGILRMTQRAELLGGTCKLMIVQGQGTRLKVMIPLGGEEM